MSFNFPMILYYFSLVILLETNLYPFLFPFRASLIAQFVKNSQFYLWARKIHWRKDRLPTQVFLVFLVAQLLKNLPAAIWETLVRSLGWEYPLEKGKATHSSILAWRIPGAVQSMGSQRVRHDWVTHFHFTFKNSIMFIKL